MVAAKMRSPSGISLPRRSFNSSAALLVKVIAKMRSGAKCQSLTAKRALYVSTLVLPEPGPAMIAKGFGGAVTACFLCLVKFTQVHRIHILIINEKASDGGNRRLMEFGDYGMGKGESDFFVAEPPVVAVWLVHSFLCTFYVRW